MIIIKLDKFYNFTINISFHFQLYVKFIDLKKLITDTKHYTTITIKSIKFNVNCVK